MTTAGRQRIPPQSGVAFRVVRGETLVVIDPEGEQVADLVAFGDDGEWLSSGRSLDYANTIYLTTGNTLYSNRSAPMFTITADDVGRHDFLLAPCSPEMFERSYGFEPGHPSCFANLANALRPHGIDPDRIPTAFNVFMNVKLDASGHFEVRPPLSHAGASILLRAEMDLLVGLTACSAELSNNWAFKPIDYEVLR
jgi:uncharacterized protein YcgI (DUF1989 family)